MNNIKIYTTKILFSCAIIAFGLSGQSIAQVGITSVPFLQIEPDSRGAGMGNANVAIADNASALFWNPAGLAFQRGSQASITHANWLPQFNADLFYDYLVGKTYIEGIGTIGGHITFLNLGEQIRTDEQGNELGTFRSYDITAGVAYGYEITKNLGVGIGMRYIFSRLVPAGTDVGAQTARAGTSLAFDISSLYKSNTFNIGDNLASYSVGFNLSNVGGSVQYADEAQKDPLPTLLRAGWAFNYELDPDGYNTITIANDISKIMARKTELVTINGTDTTRSFETANLFDAIFNSWGDYTYNNGTEDVTLSLAEQLMIGVGAEYWYDRKFALRAGYFYESPNNGDREFLTFGAGLRIDIFGVDFSYIYTLSENHPLANTVRFSVLVNFD